MGGWAVHFHVDKVFFEREKRSYVGSRDLDIAFDIPKSCTKDQLEKSELCVALKKILDLGFNKQGFRFYKDFDLDSGRELSDGESKKQPIHTIFKMYMDPMVPHTPPFFKEIAGFDPIDEPLLEYFFEKGHKQEFADTHMKAYIPSVELITAMKLRCSYQRQKQEKIVKDIADVFALLWYTEGFENVKKKLFKIISRDEVILIIKKWNPKHVIDAAKFIDVDPKTISQVFDNI